MYCHRGAQSSGCRMYCNRGVQGSGCDAIVTTMLNAGFGPQPSFGLRLKPRGQQAVGPKSQALGP